MVGCREGSTWGGRRPHQVLLLGLLFAFSSLGIEEEVVDNSRLLTVREMREEEGVVCLRPLQGRPNLVVELRMEVKRNSWPIRSFIAGKVTTPPDLLRSHPHWCRLSYANTEVNRTHSLEAALDNITLPYVPYMDNMFAKLFDFERIILLVEGRVEMLSECPTTESPTTTSSSSPSPDTPTEISTTPAIVTTTTTTPSDPPAASTNSPSINYTEAPGWLWTLGSAGSMPVFIILIIVVVLLVVLTVPAVILFCRWKGKDKVPKRSASQQPSPFKNVYEPSLEVASPLLPSSTTPAPPPDFRSNTENSDSFVKVDVNDPFATSNAQTFSSPIYKA